MTDPKDLRLASEDAKFLRDEGIALSADAADARNPLWQHRALETLKAYLRTHRFQFMTEDFRRWAESEGNLPTPPSGRAYGAVMTAAYKNRIIQHQGYCVTTNPKAHRTPASLWIVTQN